MSSKHNLDQQAVEDFAALLQISAAPEAGPEAE